MPQAIGVWCEEAGHDVTLVCYTGFGDVTEDLPDNLDLAFIGTFTQGAQLAYALSARLRSEGTITVLGGPHVRCYPEDAQQYFDYVVGFTDKAVIQRTSVPCGSGFPRAHCIRIRMPISKRNTPMTPKLRRCPSIRGGQILSECSIDRGHRLDAYASGILS